MSDHFVLPLIAKNVLTDSRFFAEDDDDTPFGGKLYAGDPRVLLVVGENASGKSLLFRVIAAFAKRDHNLTGITISIRERTGAGTREMSGMMRVFMFGDEEEQSTGATSANVVEAGFHNAGRDGGKTLLMLDEPEIGLSDGYARALGAFIAQKTIEIGQGTHGIVIVTHNRPLVQGFLEAFGAAPTFINLGGQQTDLKGWLKVVEQRSVEDLLQLRAVAGERRKAVQALINNKGK
jgi:hypothetical protein